VRYGPSVKETLAIPRFFLDARRANKGRCDIIMLFVASSKKVRDIDEKIIAEVIKDMMGVS
jgi:hypothetical protein